MHFKKGFCKEFKHISSNDTSTGGREMVGIEPPTMWSVDKSLHLLSHRHYWFFTFVHVFWENKYSKLIKTIMEMILLKKGQLTLITETVVGFKKTFKKSANKTENIRTAGHHFGTEVRTSCN